MVVPEFQNDRFVQAKGKNTKRVFCLGESTMEGFPYEFNPTPPSFLRDKLAAELPGDTIEVVNVGLSAAGSYVVTDVMQQLLDYQPDLFVVYLGHNEFYGAYGAGSSIGSGNIPWLTRLSVRLLHLKTYLLLRNSLAWLTGQSAGDRLPADATLMQQMVGNAQIPLGSRVYQTALQGYRENLAIMIDLAQSRHIPILFSTLVSNERDQPPFAGMFDEATSPPARLSWRTLLARADSLLRTGQNEKALEACRTAVEIDSENANGYFSLARALEARERFTEARDAYLRAKDLDGLRFRATQEFQQTLLEVCRQSDVPCARADLAFVAASPNGIIGHELIIEHLHPNIRGYFLLASVWGSAIMDNGLLGRDEPSRTIPADSLLFQQSMVSAFDENLGMIKTALLSRKWPFRVSPDLSPFKAQDSVQAIVLAYVYHQRSWSNSRYELAQYYARHRQFELARRECLAVSRIIPFSYQPLLRVADYYADEGKKDEAAMAYRRCIAAEDNPYAHMKLGLLLIQAGSDSAGAWELERGFALDGRNGMTVPLNAKATGRFLLGLAYARTGRIDAAKESLQLALTLDPGLNNARVLLKQLP